MGMVLRAVFVISQVYLLQVLLLALLLLLLPDAMKAEEVPLNGTLCPVGRRLDKGTCAWLRLDDPCKTPAECQASVENSHCPKGTCQCQEGFHRFFSSDWAAARCVASELVHVVCDTDALCLAVSNSSCYFSDPDRGHGHCVCNPGFKAAADNKTCEAVRLGDDCYLDDDCNATVAHAVCAAAGNVCACGEGYRETPSGTCEVSLTGDSCNETSCISQIGKTCEADLECFSLVANSECRNGTCHCLAGYTPSNMNGTSQSLCERRSFGSPCEISDDCTVAFNNSACIESRCRCQDDFAFSDKNSTCVRVQRLIGSSCDTDNECALVINSSACNSNLCSCGVGNRPSENGSTCEGDACKADVVCLVHIQHSQCGNYICRCLPGFAAAENGAACHRQTLGSRCSQDEDCTATFNFSRCHEGACRCLDNHTESETLRSCLSLRLGHVCSEDLACSLAVGRSRCASGRCTCMPGHVLRSDDSRDLCLPRKLGEDCADDVDCQSAINGSACVDKKCECAAHFRRTSDNSSTCAPIRRIGDECERDVDCYNSVRYSRCDNGTCQCRLGLRSIEVEEVQHCVRYPRHVGDKCWSDAMCPASSVCGANGTCRCLDTHLTTVNRTACRAFPEKVGEACERTEHCRQRIANSTCLPLAKTCQCPADFFPDLGHTRCQPNPRHLGDRCLTSLQCRRQHSECAANQTCACVYGYHQKNGFCIARSVITPYTPVRPRPAPLLCDTSATENPCAQHNPWLSCASLPEPRQGKGTPTTPSLSVNATSVAAASVADGAQLAAKGQQHGNVTPESSDGKLSAELKGEKGARDPMGHCVCPPRFRFNHKERRCVGVQTYQVTLNIVRVAARYEYVSLHFAAFLASLNHSDGAPIPTSTKTINSTSTANFQDSPSSGLNVHTGNGTDHKVSDLGHATSAGHSVAQEEPVADVLLTPDAYQQLADRITLGGMRHLLILSPLLGRYHDSDVLRMSDLNPGLRVVMLLHLSAVYDNYLYPLSLGSMTDIVIKQLHRFEGELGKSRLKLQTPLSIGVSVEDFDECQSRSTHDCSPHAWCINTLGSFLCICHVGYDEASYRNRSNSTVFGPFNNLYMGRNCEVPKPEEEDGKACSGSDCESDWVSMSLVISGFFLIIIIMIVYEICKRQHQSTARDLYERFGTTSIRRLRLAVSKARDMRAGRDSAPNIAFPSPGRGRHVVQDAFVSDMEPDTIPCHV